MDELPEDLIASIRKGDAQAMARFLDARRPQLIAYVDRRLGAALRRKVEPEDVVQETCAEALRALPEVDLSSRDPFGWLCQVAERRIIDAHRRFFGSQKRAAAREVSIHAPVADSSQAGLLNLLVASMTSASQAFSRDQKQLRMMDALGQLPAEHREALMLRYLEGLPSKEIAERLGKTDGSVRVMLTRSLAKLQQMLGDLDK